MLKEYRPFLWLLYGYIGMILLGTLLLLIPVTHRGHLSIIDALFTVTSAICVTGLIVKDTAHFFTPIGKAIILIWIQIGGIGYMTMATLIFFAFGKKGSLKFRLAMAESFPELSIGNIFSFARNVALYTFLLEGVGFFLLTIGFTVAGLSFNKSILHALFHSVSAFCNAGFSSFSLSLGHFKGNPIINLTVIGLFVFGGLGFIVLNEIYERVKGLRKKLTLHTKIVLLTTALLLSGGFIVLFIGEFGNAFKNYNIGTKILVSLFQAATPRTAGFSTVSLANFHGATLFFLLLLMVVGGSPGGTAGGVKTTTTAAIFLWLKARLSRREEATAFGYRLPEDSIKRTFTVMILAVLTLVVSTFFILIFEEPIYRKMGLMPLLFEVVSAFGTVGLSIGSPHIPFVSLSGDFSVFGKGVIIITMLIGRVGVLTIGALLLGGKREPIRYVEGRYVVG